MQSNKRIQSFLLVISFFALILQGTQRGFASSTSLLLVAHDGLTRLDTNTGDLTLLPNQPLTSQSLRGATSSTTQSMLYWYPNHIFTTGFWSVKSGSPPIKIRLSFSTNVKRDSDIDFADVRWLLGDKYLLIEIGKHVSSRNLAQGLREISSRWVIDMSTLNAVLWNYNCDEVLLLKQPKSMFIVKCAPDENNQTAISEAKYLTYDGIVNQFREIPDIVYGQIQQSVFGPSWWFSGDVTSIAFVDFSGNILKQKIQYKSASQNSFHEIDQSGETILRLSWSPSGKYLVNFNQCYKLPKCIEIRDVNAQTIIWNSAQLRLNDVLYADEIVWSPSETSFFLLGHENATPYVWKVDLNTLAVISKWAVPSDTYHMILEG